MVPLGRSAIQHDTGVWEYTERAWDYRDDGLCIVLTALGLVLWRTSPPGVPDPQASNPYLRPHG
jgi:hypothetical protein